MILGEKIYKLRKEKGLSQESLAELLGTTRQAVSKWENNQGYPETEKLLLLSNVFGVSVDFLLKDEKTEKTSDEKGYYVSCEMAMGYIANEMKTSKFCGVGCSFFALAGVPYIALQTTPVWKIFCMSACILIGIIFIVFSMFSARDEYNILKKESLLLDYEFLKKLTNEYCVKKRKFIIFLGICTIVLIAGILLLAITVKEMINWTEYHSLVFLGLSVGIFGFVYFLGAMEAYEVLCYNDKYSNSLWFKIKHKLRTKIEEL